MAHFTVFPKAINSMYTSEGQNVFIITFSGVITVGKEVVHTLNTVHAQLAQTLNTCQGFKQRYGAPHPRISVTFCTHKHK